MNICTSCGQYWDRKPRDDNVCISCREEHDLDVLVAERNAMAAIAQLNHVAEEHLKTCDKGDNCRWQYQQGVLYYP